MPSAVLASWKDGPAKRAIVDFVARTVSPRAGSITMGLSGASSRSAFIIRRKNLSAKDNARSSSSPLGTPVESLGRAAGAPDNLLFNSAFS